MIKKALSIFCACIFLFIAASCGAKGPTLKQFNDAISDFDKVARAGDVRMLDYLVFSTETEHFRPRLEEMLNNEQGKTLWKLSYAPTVLTAATERDLKSILEDGDTLVACKLPRRNQSILRMAFKHHYEIFDPESYDSLLAYYTTMSEDMVMIYLTARWAYVDGGFKLQAGDFLSNYLDNGAFNMEDFSPINPFKSAFYTSYSTNVSKASEEEQQVMQYMALLAEQRYAEAFRYRQRYGPNPEDKYVKIVEFYEGLSEEDKALVQEEFDKCPPTELYFYSETGSNELIKGNMFTYAPIYQKRYEVYGEGLPVYNLNSIYLSEWQFMDREDHIYENLENVLKYLFPDADL